MKLFSFAALCLLLALAVVGVSVETTRAMARDAEQACGRLNSEKLDQTVEAVRSLCVTQQDGLRQLLEVDLKSAHTLAAERGGFRLAPETVTWSAINQFTRAGGSVRLPKMTLGKTWLGQNADPKRPSPLVDEVLKITGATCTVFQRVNDDGDMIRVCTNIEDASGRRAIGTFIPAVGPDGKPNAVVATVLRGETYIGRAFVVRAWYISAYEPILDSTGRVIGALYVGVPQENVPALRTAISDMRVGTTGRTFVIDSQGNWVIRPRDGPSEDLQPVVKELAGSGPKLAAGAVAERAHVRENADGSPPARKVIRFTYFAPWDWVIGVVVDEAEVQDVSAGVVAQGRRQLVLLGAISGGALVLILTCALVLARAICRPIAQIVQVLEATAAADFSRRVEITSRDEVGRMGAALNTAIDALRASQDAEQKQAEKDRAAAEAERQRAAELAERERLQAEKDRAATEAERRRATELAERERLQAEKDRLQAEKDRAAAAREAERSADLRDKVSTILVTVNAMAAGDFTHQVPDMGTDGVGQMAAALNAAIVSVRSALEGVRAVSDRLAEASGRLAGASEEIARDAQQQATSLEKTAAAMEEITATAVQNSDSAQQACQLASGSRDVAERGGTVVGRAVEAMGEINRASKRIAEIVTAINAIAAQTNLLALNAAVEAARAGEQGRGFAVVAAEVRSLARRSADAAKEVESLVCDSVRKVDTGTDLVNRSGATLAEIVTSIKHVTDIVTQIADASREQSAGFDQVNQAVTQLDAVTQRNTSQTEEMSATAQSLTEQAGQLRDLVGRFKLVHEDDLGRAAGAPPGRGAHAAARKAKNGHAHGPDHRAAAAGAGAGRFTGF